MHRECRERFYRHRLQRKPLVRDHGLHHGTCVMHVPWCMSGSLIRGGGENVPGIPGACATRNLTYLSRGPWHVNEKVQPGLVIHCTVNYIDDWPCDNDTWLCITTSSWYDSFSAVAHLQIWWRDDMETFSAFRAERESSHKLMTDRHPHISHSQASYRLSIMSIMGKQC